MVARTVNSLIVVFACVAALFGASAHAADTPMSFAMLAFAAGEWRHESDSGEYIETLRAVTVLGASALYVQVEVETGGGKFDEVWIAGFDPAREGMYLDVYSAGGYRAAMDGAMVVPGKVWAFETPGAGAKERRVITKISDAELAVKYEFAAPGRPVQSVERFYVRVTEGGEVPDISGEDETAGEPEGSEGAE